MCNGAIHPSPLHRGGKGTDARQSAHICPQISRIYSAPGKIYFLTTDRHRVFPRGFNFPAHRNLRVSEGVENLLR
jgi:hypothetical protein